LVSLLSDRAVHLLCKWVDICISFHYLILK
jgi:hypothetical protein